MSLAHKKLTQDRKNIHWHTYQTGIPVNLDEKWVPNLYVTPPFPEPSVSKCGGLEPNGRIEVYTYGVIV